MNIRINSQVNRDIQRDKYKVDKQQWLTIRLRMFNYWYER